MLQGPRDPANGTSHQVVLGLQQLNRQAFADAVMRETSHLREPPVGPLGLSAAHIATGGGIALSAGFVSWILRSGAIASALLATMPAWKRFDPLPILLKRNNKRNDERLASDADRMFDKKSGTAAEGKDARP